MTTTTKFYIGALALLATSSLFAQQGGSCCTWFPKGDDDSQGVLGKRYAEAGLLFEDIRHTSHNLYGAGLGANVPVLKNVDLSVGYEYGTYNIPTYSYASGTRVGDMHVHNHSVGGSLQVFNEIEDGVKPFVSLGLYRDLRDSSGPLNNIYAANRTEWDAEIGAEIPYKSFSLIPSIKYSDDFKTSSQSFQTLTYSLEGNSWLTRRFGVFARIAFSDVMHSSQDNWDYAAGIRVRF